MYMHAHTHTHTHRECSDKARAVSPPHPSSLTYITASRLHDGTHWSAVILITLQADQIRFTFLIFLPKKHHWPGDERGIFETYKCWTEAIEVNAGFKWHALRGRKPQAQIQGEAGAQDHDHVYPAIKICHKLLSYLYGFNKQNTISDLVSWSFKCK